MAGHSKWANIKHRKAKQDAAKGKVFTKYIREIVSSAKQGDPDPNKNPRLRAAVEKALSVNMTKDTIARAIERGAGGGESDTVAEVVYEGYGVGGVAVLVETMTDNLNRTVAEVRHAFTKHQGNLGTSGSVAYLFVKRAELVFDDLTKEEPVTLTALDAGAYDIEVDDVLTVIAEPDQFGPVKDALDAAGLIADSAEVTLSATTTAHIDDLEQAQTLLKMIDMLNDLDDVQNVYTNLSLSDEVMETIDT